MYWTCGSGRIDLQITKAQAESASHSGSCDDDVAALIREPRIARQVAKWDPADLAEELKGYGAWEPEELADHDANVARMVWIAAGDITDGNC